MYIFRQYDEANRIDRAWYDSTSVIYSECDDNDNSLKTLRVTFKNGSTYEYYDVDVNDYLMFLHGGLDGSNGKALNKFIKSKYDFKRIGDIEPSKISEQLEELKASTDSI